MTATDIDRALCCGQTCGRTRPEHGECVAATHGRAQRERLEAAGFIITPANPASRWYHPTEDSESSYSSIDELLSDHPDDIVEIGHNANIKTTWHVRLYDEENGTEWREFATQAEALAFHATLPDPPDDEAPR